jgi:2-polyprenyl-3-methyl-5-hydroxy-6-metoxy-1,4-benzoquinol methylase
MSTNMKPTYGSSDHYLDNKGKDYFAWQNSTASFAARIIAHRYRDFIAPSHTVVDFGCGGGLFTENAGL